MSKLITKENLDKYEKEYPEFDWDYFDKWDNIFKGFNSGLLDKSPEEAFKGIDDLFKDVDDAFKYREFIIEDD